MHKQSANFFKNALIEAPIQNTIFSTKESIVGPCSSGVASPHEQCFTNSACYAETPVSKATGQLQWQNLSNAGYEQNVSGKRWGTAFFISPNLIMTAGHCFDVATGGNDWKTPKINGNFLSPQKLATIIKLNMDYQHESCLPSFSGILPANEVSFKIKKLVEHRIAGLDYAIAEVEGSPGSSYGFVEFDFSFTVGNIYIVQHPNGAPKKQEIGYGKVSDNMQIINHNVNTLGGSSGSCVANYNFKGCGVHIQGRDGNGWNSALHIDYVRQKSPIIHGFFSLQHPTILKSPALNVPPQEQSNQELLWGLGAICAICAIGGSACLTSKNKTVKNTGIASIVGSIIIGIVIICLTQSQNQKKYNDKNEFVHGELNFSP